jgi:hypothetical protein
MLRIKMAAGFQEKIILKFVDSQLLHLLRRKLCVQMKRNMIMRLVQRSQKWWVFLLISQKWWVVDWCEMKKSIFSQSVANLFSRCRSIMLHFIWTRSFNLIKCRSWLATNSKIIFSWNPAILILRVLGCATPPVRRSSFVYTMKLSWCLNSSAYPITLIWNFDSNWEIISCM